MQPSSLVITARFPARVIYNIIERKARLRQARACAVAIDQTCVTCTLSGADTAAHMGDEAAPIGFAENDHHPEVTPPYDSVDVDDAATTCVPTILSPPIVAPFIPTPQPFTPLLSRRANFLEEAIAHPSLPRYANYLAETIEHLFTVTRMLHTGCIAESVPMRIHIVLPPYKSANEIDIIIRRHCTENVRTIFSSLTQRTRTGPSSVCTSNCTYRGGCLTLFTPESKQEGCNYALHPICPNSNVGIPNGLGTLQGYIEGINAHILFTSMIESSVAFVKRLIFLSYLNDAEWQKASASSQWSLMEFLYVGDNGLSVRFCPWCLEMSRLDVDVGLIPNWWCHPSFSAVCGSWPNKDIAIYEGVIHQPTADETSQDVESDDQPILVPCEDSKTPFVSTGMPIALPDIISTRVARSRGSTKGKKKTRTSSACKPVGTADARSNDQTLTRDIAILHQQIAHELFLHELFGLKPPTQRSTSKPKGPKKPKKTKLEKKLDKGKKRPLLDE